MIRGKRSNSHSHFFNSQKHLIKCKRSQGEIIATILLVLLAIAAISILIAYVIPLVKDWLSRNDCFDYSGKLDLTNNEKYTCYDSTSGTLNLQVHIGDIDENGTTSIKELVFVIGTNLESRVFKIIPPDSEPAGITMFSGATNLEIPGKNQERTYKISLGSRPNQTIVYPVLNNNHECADGAYVANYIPFC